MNRSQPIKLRTRLACCLMAGLVLASGCGPAKVEAPSNVDPANKPVPARKKTEL